MNNYRHNNYVTDAQGIATLCGWARVAEISVPVVSQVSLNAEMAKDFGHDPGGSDG